MSDILIARQPAFDRAGSAVGYELRFRPVVDEGDPFARSYVSGSFDVLRSGLRAYVRCTRPSHGRVRRRTGGGLRSCIRADARVSRAGSSGMDNEIARQAVQRAHVRGNRRPRRGHAVPHRTLLATRRDVPSRRDAAATRWPAT